MLEGAFACLGAILAIWLIYLVKSDRRTHDDTDLGKGQLSDMKLLTDYGTGCQYLSHWFGLTPRMNAEGKHMCNGQRRGSTP